MAKDGTLAIKWRGTILKRGGEIMQTLLAKTCPECDKATAPLTGEKLQELQDELGHDWAVIDEHHLEKTWHLKNFAEALAMTNKIGAVADAQGHHPDIYLTWG